MEMTHIDETLNNMRYKDHCVMNIADFYTAICYAEYIDNLYVDMTKFPEQFYSFSGLKTLVVSPECSFDVSRFKNVKFTFKNALGQINVVFY